MKGVHTFQQRLKINKEWLNVIWWITHVSFYHGFKSSGFLKWILCFPADQYVCGTNVLILSQLNPTLKEFSRKLQSLWKSKDIPVCMNQSNDQEMIQCLPLSFPLLPLPLSCPVFICDIVFESLYVSVSVFVCPSVCFVFICACSAVSLRVLIFLGAYWFSLAYLILLHYFWLLWPSG